MNASKRRAAQQPVKEPLSWPRADPIALARFDPSTKLCTMNCGPSRNDPRTDAERKFLCDDCLKRDTKT